MTGHLNFRDRQMDLQRRLGRQRPRSLVRRRLERELRSLVVAELQAEASQAPSYASVPEYPEQEGHELAWWQK